MYNFATLFFAFLASFGVIALSQNVLLTILTKLGFKQIIREEGPSSHQSKSKTPTAGGLSFYLVFSVIWVFLLVLQSLFNINWLQALLFI
ncbi:MAG TPA: hypothetical protein V6C96_01100, partial [Vampirovibrionales bacterium]